MREQREDQGIGTLLMRRAAVAMGLALTAGGPLTAPRLEMVTTDGCAADE